MKERYLVILPFTRLHFLYISTLMLARVSDVNICFCVADHVMNDFLSGIVGKFADIGPPHVGLHN